ncbi:hypothetical protein [Paenibacillus bouchesdurhonensis]|uniref:hypothetical protein n=1 Tax=Paenibacillus bouchesdurhonensis TaxID=1870990 RepID=UPI000DA5F138|nr:hypothetical protein [Paenibacillus bouchesdurhonensis]
MEEYAKILRWSTDKAVYGLKTTIQLPKTATFEKNVGFINFYLGVYGANVHYECGLSTKPAETANDYWHWFWNTGFSNDGGPWMIKGGATIPIELSMNCDNQLEFKVAGEVVKTFYAEAEPFGALTNARLVVAACDQKFESIPDPLPEWATRHDAVICDCFSFRDSCGTWVTMSSLNSNPPTSTIFWPTGHEHTGTTADYTTILSVGRIIASLKD